MVAVNQLTLYVALLPPSSDPRHSVPQPPSQVCPIAVVNAIYDIIQPFAPFRAIVTIHFSLVANKMAKRDSEDMFLTALVRKRLGLFIVKASSKGSSNNID